MLFILSKLKIPNPPFSFQQAYIQLTRPYFFVFQIYPLPKESRYNTIQLFPLLRSMPDHEQHVTAHEIASLLLNLSHNFEMEASTTKVISQPRKFKLELLSIYHLEISPGSELGLPSLSV